jgi:hypothetical protein
MLPNPQGGYTGTILRVDLSSKRIIPEKWDVRTMADSVEIRPRWVCTR